jgi:hypothetical protein
MPSKAVWLGKNSVAVLAHTRSSKLFGTASHLSSLDSIHYVAGRNELVKDACSIGIEIEFVANEKGERRKEKGERRKEKGRHSR